VNPRAARLALLAAATAASLVLAACASHRPTLALPTAPGTALPDADAIAAAAFPQCAGLTTLTAEIRLSGRAGREKLRGKLVAGFKAPDAIRVEAVAPFGQPVFILAAAGADATLLLPRDGRVLRQAAPAAILEALAGIALAPAELLPLLAGCPSLSPSLTRPESRGPDWAVFTDADRTVYLHRTAGQWRLAAVAGPALVAEYDAWTGRQPASVHLRDGGPGGAAERVDLRLALSQVETNVELPADAFRVNVPADASPLSLDELRETGPMRDTTAPGAPR
jgi:hypothetical protein